MKRVLDHLRSQSDDIKIRIALMSGGVLTVLIVLAWIFALPHTGISHESLSSDAPSPFRALLGGVSQATKTVRWPGGSGQNQQEPSIASQENTSSYDESNPASTSDVFQGEPVYSEDSVATPNTSSDSPEKNPGVDPDSHI